jgi:MFS family permease
MPSITCRDADAEVQHLCVKSGRARRGRWAASRAVMSPITANDFLRREPSDYSAAMTSRRFYGWTLLAIFWLILLIASAMTLYGGGVLNGYMAADLGVDRAARGVPMSVYQLLFGLGAPVVALFIDRWGIRACLAGGGVLIVAGALTMALVVQNVTHATLAFGCVVGAGAAAAGGITTQAGVTRWFRRRRALALAILFSAPGIGGFFIAPSLNRLVVASGGNWRLGWFVVAAAALVVVALALLLVKEQPADVGQVPDGDGLQVVPDAKHPSRSAGLFITTHDWLRRDVLRSRAFWLMLVAVLGVNAGFVLFFALGVTHLQDLGHSATAGAWALSVFGISALAGKAALALFGDRFDPRYVWAVTIAGFGLGMVFIADARSARELALFPVFLGFGYGGGVACMMAVLGNYYGPKAFASVAGLAVAITTTAGAVAPMIAGALYHDLGSYTGVFQTLAVWCFAGAVLMAVVRRPVHPELAAARPFPLTT